MKPADIQIRAIEFFSIWLPGALLAAALIVAFGSRPVPPAIAMLLATDPARWVAFALLSYALGHVVSQAASPIDSFLYSRYRRRASRYEDSAYDEATALRHLFFGTVEGDRNKPMHTFQWSKALLLMKAPAARADVDQFEADSKFFRSLIIVMPLVGTVASPTSAWWGLPATLVAAAIAFFIYADRRYKSIELAYRYVLVASRLEAERAIKPAGSA